MQSPAPKVREGTIRPTKKGEPTTTVTLPESSKAINKYLIGIVMPGPGSFARTFLLPPMTPYMILHMIKLYRWDIGLRQKGTFYEQV